MTLGLLFRCISCCLTLIFQSLLKWMYSYQKCVARENNFINAVTKGQKQEVRGSVVAVTFARTQWLLQSVSMSPRNCSSHLRVTYGLTNCPLGAICHNSLALRRSKVLTGEVQATSHDSVLRWNAAGGACARNHQCQSSERMDTQPDREGSKGSAVPRVSPGPMSPCQDFLATPSEHRALWCQCCNLWEERGNLSSTDIFPQGLRILSHRLL